MYIWRNELLFTQKNENSFPQAIEDVDEFVPEDRLVSVVYLILNVSKYEETNSSTFSANFYFGVNYSIKMCLQKDATIEHHYLLTIAIFCCFLPYLQKMLFQRYFLTVTAKHRTAYL